MHPDAEHCPVCTSLAPGIVNFGVVVVGADVGAAAGVGVRVAGGVDVSDVEFDASGCAGFGCSCPAGVVGVGAGVGAGAGVPAPDARCLWFEQNLNHPPFQRLVAVLVQPGAWHCGPVVAVVWLLRLVSGLLVVVVFHPRKSQ